MTGRHARFIGAEAGTDQAAARILRLIEQAGDLGPYPLGHSDGRKCLHQRGQPPLQFQCAAPVGEDAPGRYAGGAAVQPQAVGQRLRRQVKVGAGQHEDGVVAGQLHHGRSQVGRQIGQHPPAGLGRAGQHQLVHTGGDGLAARLDRLIQQPAKTRRQAGFLQKLQQRPHRFDAAGSGFDQDGVAGGERLDDLNAGQE